MLFRSKADDSVFTNGIRQNVIILRDLFAKCRNISEAYIINTAKDVTIPHDDSTTWGKYAKHIITVEEAKQKCDLIVIGQGSILREEYKVFKSLGKKITKLLMGAELSVFNETILYKDNKEARNIYSRNSGTVSAVWISPHYFARDRYFFEIQYDCPTYVGPYVWDPRFIQHHIDVFKSKDEKETGLYKPSGEIEKRISTMEPNISIVKTSVVPIITVEHLYRKYPETLKLMNVFCGNNISKKTDLINYVKDMEAYKNKKMFFEARYPVVYSLLKHTDILLCHQNQNELNYLHLDAAWMGYPVVHNSDMMKDLGWYYEGNNSHQAIEHINYLAKYFDENEHHNEEYLKKSRQFAYRYMIDNPENIRGYEKLIEIAMDSKI